MKNHVALNHHLKAFDSYLTMDNVTEICINRPFEVWVEQAGRFVQFDEPAFTDDFLMQFAHLVAEANQREISREYPTLSSILPNGLRVQFVVEPACESGTFICAIRQKSIKQMTLSHYFTKSTGTTHCPPSMGDKQLLHDYLSGDYETFLTNAVLQKKNIIISGGTSTGKTTFLNSLLQLIPLTERLVTIETDREVISSHQNTVHLLAAEEGKSVAHITMLGLLKATLRLRPDRILVSELRAEEAFPFLRAVNSGHPGSITTLHADSPNNCFDQLAFMVMQGKGMNITRSEIIAYAKSIINIVVQINRTADGQRYISDIYFDLAQGQEKTHAA